MRHAMTMLALIGPPVAAQQPPPARCLIPSHLWDGAERMTAAMRMPVGRPPTLVPDRPAIVRLATATQVRFDPPLAKAAAAADMGGLARLHIADRGTYRIAIQHKAWIDVVRAGKPLTSVAHAHGAPCSGIAKTVVFALDRGDYVVQLSDSADEDIGLLISDANFPRTECWTSDC